MSVKLPWEDPDYRGSEEIDGPFNPVSVGAVAKEVAAIAEVAMKLRPECESPIEVDLGAHILRLLSLPFRLQPQFRMGRFRYDFAIMFDEHAVLLIECDGKEFHSTEEQIENDRRKDEQAHLAGIKIIRFTGSSIFRDPADCAAKVIKALQ